CSSRRRRTSAVHPTCLPTRRSSDLVARGELEQKQGFVFRLFGLHGDGRIYSARLTLRLQIFGQEVTLQDGHFLGDPGMPHGMVFPEMLVRIDLHDKSPRHFTALPKQFVAL